MAPSTRPLRPRPLQLSDGRLISFGSRTTVMGILNVTPDSFSDGGRYRDVDLATEHGLRLWEEGADILDIGGESTRPGSEAVSSEEEIERVVPVIEALVREKSDLVLSIDTTKAQVAEAALGAGAHIVNDISGLGFDPNMVHTVAKHGCPTVIMHIRGTPATMQNDVSYTSVIDEVSDFFEDRLDFAVQHGVKRDQIVLDPGIGFGKLLHHNVAILHSLSQFHRLGRPILVGPSRKRYLGEILDRPVDERIFGTAASVAWAITQGAQLVRVHDVKEMRDVCDVVDRISSNLPA